MSCINILYINYLYISPNDDVPFPSVYEKKSAPFTANSIAITTLLTGTNFGGHMKNYTQFDRVLILLDLSSSDIVRFALLLTLQIFRD